MPVVVQLVLADDADAVEGVDLVAERAELDLGEEQLFEVVDVLKIAVGIDDHHLILREGQGHAVDEGIDDDLVPHVLALVYQCAVGLADLVDLLAVVLYYVEVAVHLLLVLDLEVEAPAEESDVHLLLVLHCLVTEAIAELFELYGDLRYFLRWIFLDYAGDWHTVAFYSFPCVFLQFGRRLYAKPPDLTFLIKILALGLAERLVEIASIGDESGVPFAEIQQVSAVSDALYSLKELLILGFAINVVVKLAEHEKKDVAVHVSYVEGVIFAYVDRSGCFPNPYLKTLYLFLEKVVKDQRFG